MRMKSFDLREVLDHSLRLSQSGLVHANHTRPTLKLISPQS